MVRKLHKDNLHLFAKNFIFGVEDSLVSTVGLVSGIAVTSSSKFIVILSGVILIMVEAFSMGVGSFLSEKAIEESKRKKNNDKNTIKAAIIMFFSYIIAGLVPLTPYILLDKDSAFIISNALSIVSLFLLGIFSGKILRINHYKNGFRMMFLGSFVIVLGMIVGKIVENLLKNA